VQFLSTRKDCGTVKWRFLPFCDLSFKALNVYVYDIFYSYCDQYSQCRLGNQASDQSLSGQRTEIIKMCGGFLLVFLCHKMAENAILQCHNLFWYLKTALELLFFINKIMFYK